MKTFSECFFEDAKHPQCFQGKSRDVFVFFSSFFLSQPFDRWTNDKEDFVEKLKSSSTCSEEMVVSRTITVNSHSSECEEVPWDYDILEVLGQGSAGKVLRVRQDA